MQRDVWDDGRVVEEKRLFPVVADELQRLFVDAVRRVVFALEYIIAARVGRVGALGQRGVPRHGRLVVQRHALQVAPQIIRIIAVRVALAVVAVEPVEALMDRIALRAGEAQTPLAERAGRVALVAQQLGHRDFIPRDWPLAFRLNLAVVPHERVPRVLAGHQHTARRRADGVAGVVAREPHALLGQAIEVGGLDFFLAVTAQLGVTEIVRHDEDDVRLGCLGRLGQGECRDNGRGKLGQAGESGLE